MKQLVRHYVAAILSPIDTVPLNRPAARTNLTDKTGATRWEEVCYTIVGHMMERKASCATAKEAV